MKSLFANTDQIRQSVPQLHRHFDFEELKPITIRAARQHLLPWIGEGTYNQLADQADGTASTDEMGKLLPYAQSAVGQYTYYLVHDTHAVHVSSQGVQESYSPDGTSQPAGDWKRHDSKRTAANFADQDLETLLNFLEGQVLLDASLYSSWQNSDPYKQIFDLLIWNSFQLASELHVKSSFYLLQSMTPSIRHVQRRDIEPLLGTSLYNTLMAAIKARPASGLTAAQTALIDNIRPYLARRAMLDAIPARRVEYVSGGVFFRTYDGPIARQQKQDIESAIGGLTRRLEHEVAGSWMSLQKWLDSNAADYPEYDPKSYKMNDGGEAYKSAPTRFRGSVSI